LEGGFEIHLKGAQIAAVNANQVAAGIERPFELRFVMRFAQNVEALGARDSGQRHQFFLFEGGDDQQNCVGAICLGFHNLELIDDEILAQAGQGTGRRSFAQIVKRAQKKRFVGQHRQCGRARPRSRASSEGLKSARIKPFEGEAFLSTAITAMPGPWSAMWRNRFRNPRGVCAAAARSKARRSQFLRRSGRRWRVAATMESREAGMAKTQLYGSCPIQGERKMDVMAVIDRASGKML